MTTLLANIFTSNPQTILEKIDSFFGIFVEYLVMVLFYDILGFPLVVIGRSNIIYTLF